MKFSRACIFFHLTYRIFFCRNKDCKYFKRGDGKCPFGNKCFYQHNLPDGTHVDVGPPPRARRRNAEGDLELMQVISLIL